MRGGRLKEVSTIGSDWEKFGVLDRWSLMGGGRLREVVAPGGSTIVLINGTVYQALSGPDLIMAPGSVR